MKRAIFIIFIFFSIITKNTECQVAYISYTLSAEYEKSSDKKVNHSIGYELLFSPYDFVHNIGFIAKNIKTDSAFTIKYALYSEIGRSWFYYGPGLMLNAGKKNTGISPSIDFMMASDFLLFTASYRYNINYKKNNSHEFGLTFSLAEILTTIMMTGF